MRIKTRLAHLIAAGTIVTSLAAGALVVADSVGSSPGRDASVAQEMEHGAPRRGAASLSEERANDERRIIAVLIGL